MDIKSTLVKLGEKLVKEYKFKPARFKYPEEQEVRTTDPLVEFILWLDRTPEAREELEKDGIMFVRTQQFIRGESS